MYCCTCTDKNLRWYTLLWFMWIPVGITKYIDKMTSSGTSAKPGDPTQGKVQFVWSQLMTSQATIRQAGKLA